MDQQQNKVTKQLNYWGLSSSLTDQEKFQAYSIITHGFHLLFNYIILSSMIAILAYTQFPKTTLLIYIFANVFMTVYCVGLNVLLKLKKAKLKKNALFNESLILSQSNILIRSVLAGTLFTLFTEMYYVLINKHKISELLTAPLLKNMALTTFLFGGAFYIMLKVMTSAQKNSQS